MPTSTQYTPIISYDLTATIASGQSVSGVVDLSGDTLCGLFLPSNFTGTTLTLQAATSSGGTFVNILSSGSNYTLTGALSTYVPIESMPILAGVRFLQITAGSSQSTSSVITLAVRPI